MSYDDDLAKTIHDVAAELVVNGSRPPARMIDRTCERCGAITRIAESILKFRPRRYCSKHCRIEAKREEWLAKNPGQRLTGSANPMYGKHPVNFNPEGNKRKDGYIRVGIGKKRILKHRLIMQEALGRELHPREVVHHVDGDNTNNAISNLKVMSQSEHMALHRKDLNAGKGITRRL